jgi:hypothetical protein
MAESNFLPELEQVAELPSGESAKSYAMLRRIEQKLNVVIRHQGIPLPDELNPLILGEEAGKLIDESRTFEAVRRHREKTGALFEDARKAIEEYLRQKGA